MPRARTTFTPKTSSVASVRTSSTLTSASATPASPWNRFRGTLKVESICVFCILIFLLSARYAYSVLTQDNMREPDVAVCFMSGATNTQTINVWVGCTDTPSEVSSEDVLSARHWVTLSDTLWEC
jgi:hypothetical protein